MPLIPMKLKINAHFDLHYLYKVPGVGHENSLKLSLVKKQKSQNIKYRVFISEVGTTVSKVEIILSVSSKSIL